MHILCRQSIKKKREGYEKEEEEEGGNIYIEICIVHFAIDI